MIVLKSVKTATCKCDNKPYIRERCTRVASKAEEVSSFISRGLGAIAIIWITATVRSAADII